MGIASSPPPVSVAGPGVAIGRRDVAAAIAVAVIEPVAAELVQAPKTVAKASAEMTTGKPAAAEAATKMAGPEATKMPVAKMSSASASASASATAARKCNGGGRHHRRA